MADSVRQTVRAPAKVNLSLRVRGRRDDGYHLLSMRNVYIDLFDELSIEFIDGEPGIELSVEGITKGLNGEDLADAAQNSVAKAYHFYQSRWPVNCSCRVHIKKNIPVGAGLAGGSSDAAALLWVMSRCFLKDDISYLTMVTESVEVGADVPFFLFGRAATVEGIGEKLSRFNFQELDSSELYLVVPSLALSTKEVFDAFAGKPRYYRKLFRPITSWAELLAEVGNDLEKTVVEKEGAVGELLSALRAIPDVTASMTGSGSACFVLSKNPTFDDTTRYRVIAEATDKGAQVIPARIKVQIPR